MSKGKAGRPPQDRQRMVQMLLEAVIVGDTEAAKKYEVTTQTLRNYRAKLQDDPIFLRQLQEAKNTLLTRTWAENLDLALNRTIVKMLEAVEGQSEYVPEALEAITGAFSALSEVALAKEVLSGGAADTQQGAAAPASSAGTQTPGAKLN